MSLFYKGEHTTCYDYKLPISANFKVIDFQESSIPQMINVDRSVMIFLLKGEVSVDCNNFRGKIHKEGEIVLLPRNSCCFVRVIKDSTCISCSFVQNIDFCNRFSFQKLVEFIPKKYVYNFAVLPIKTRLSEFLTLLRYYLDDQLSCGHLHELKEKELFLLLRAYYSKEELAMFFYPLLGNDIDFKDFVLNNYLDVADLNDFAQRANLSIDTFKRRFKDTFGEPAHKWITSRKSELIYRDLLFTDKSFTDIAQEYKLSSQSYLTAFSKQHFGKSPQELRDTTRK